MMDTSEYMPMFLAEAREHLQELNLAIVRLEQDSQDQETVQEIFRVAHSFKGMSATMGFAAIAELTHTMEDVFELLRQRTGGLSGEAVTTVLACVDALEGAVDGIEADGTEQLDAEPLIARLRELIRERTPEQEEEVAGGKIIPDPEVLAAVWAAGGTVVHVEVNLEDDTQMPAVRAHMVVASLWEYGELIGSIPAPETEDNFSGRHVEAWLVTEVDQEQIMKSVTRISDVAEVAMEVVDPAGAETTGAPPSAPETPTEAEPALAPTTPEPVLATAVATAAASAPAAAPAPAAPAPPPAPVATAAAPAPTPAPTASAAAPAATPAAAAAETRSPAATKPAASNSSHSSAHTVRVDAERLDGLMHLMGELVIHRTAIEALTHDINSPDLHSAVQELTRTSQALQSMVMQVRMIPVDVVFMRFPRLVRDLQEKLGKELELDLVGRDTELDRSVVDAIGDPLVHLVRNSLDHGLEPPAEREAAGKPRTGRLTIAARHAGGSVVIEVADDGRGVDPKVVARKALSRGLIDSEQAANLSMHDAIELLFAAGFSTSDVTSDLSGRGVGLDVVRAAIRSLGGEVQMESITGRGTNSQIRLPLTLAIISALEVDIAGAPFAIPIDHVERTLTVDGQVVRKVAGRRMISLEEGVLPLYEGSEVFGLPCESDHGLIVIVRSGDQRIGLTVDEAIGQRELVTRPMPPRISEGQPISGGAVLANGEIALIVDCDALVNFGARLQPARRNADQSTEASASGPTPDVAESDHQ